MDPFEIEPADQPVGERGRLPVDVHLDHLDDVLDLVAELEDDRALKDKEGPPAPVSRRHLVPYPLTDPASSPCTKYRWKAKNSSSGGIKDRNDAAEITSTLLPKLRIWFRMATVTGGVLPA